jgi:hypothetical protein
MTHESQKQGVVIARLLFDHHNLGAHVLGLVDHLFVASSHSEVLFARFSTK